MKLLVLCCVLSVVATVTVMRASARSSAAEPQLAHMVFFAVKDHDPELRDKLVAACHTLSAIKGVTDFSVGVMAEDVEEPGVSVKDFDVALHSVFESKAAKEAYLVDPIHTKFVKENRPLFGEVRVFDSYLTVPPAR